MSDRIYDALFQSTGNSARSLPAGGISNIEVNGCFRTFSKGSHPKGCVHPPVLKELDIIDLPPASADKLVLVVFRIATFAREGAANGSKCRNQTTSGAAQADRRDGRSTSKNGKVA